MRIEGFVALRNARSLVEKGQASVGLVSSWRSRIRMNRSKWFWLIIAIPTAFSALYYGLIASDQYFSEAQFVVRNMSSRRKTGLEMLFQTFGVSSTVDDTNAVQNYIQSRDALRSLEQKIPLRTMFSRKNIDSIAKFPRPWSGDSFEELFKYYKDRVQVTIDTTKGITKLEVTAFTPEDARKISSEILVLAEQFVNRMNTRAQVDAVKSAADDVTRAEQRVIASQRELTEFRVAAGLIDPTKDSRSVLETITSLSTDLARTMAELQRLEDSSTGNPSIRTLKAAANSLRGRIVEERGKLSGDNSALAGKLATYEQLSLSRAIAETALMNANLSLEAARQNARRQTIYVAEVASASLPDLSTRPERARMVLTFFVFSFGVAAVTWLLMAGAKEHIIE